MKYSIVYQFKCFPRTYPEKWLPNFDIKTALKTPVFSRSEQSVRNLLAPQATEVNPC